MSYCVNCGVELDQSAKKCALCSTPVINPNIKEEISQQTPFAENLQIPKSIKKEFVAFVITMTMLIPNIVMLFLNIFFIRGSFWSFYVAVVSLLLWVLFVFPWCSRKSHPYLMWGFDTLAVGGFFYALYALQELKISTLKSSLSIVILVSVAILSMIIWGRRRKHHWTAVIVVLLFNSTVVSLLSGVFTAYFSGNYNFFLVGTVICICTLVLMCFFIYCNRSKSVKAWLNKVFYL